MTSCCNVRQLVRVFGGKMSSILRREVLEAGRIKGGMLAAHVQWVADHCAPEEVARFQAALPPMLRISVKSKIVPTAWYEFRELIAIDRTIVEVFAGGDAALLRELGAYSARLNLATLLQGEQPASSVHEFLENGARFHSEYQDFGSVEYVRTGPRSGRVIHSHYSSFSPLFCESALGYYREATALHGAIDPQAIETDCQCRGDESCTFVLRWR